MPKGKGKGAYEVHARAEDDVNERDQFETFDHTHDESPYTELGGGEIGQVEMPWSVVMRKARKQTDKCPSDSVNRETESSGSRSHAFSQCRVRSESSVSKSR